MCRLSLAETVKEAVQFIEQGRKLNKTVKSVLKILDVRVGPDTITDPAFLVTR